MPRLPARTPASNLSFSAAAQYIPDAIAFSNAVHALVFLPLALAEINQQTGMERPLVLDNGGSTIKAGFAGDLQCFSITNSAARIKKQLRLLVADEIDTKIKGECKRGGRWRHGSQFGGKVWLRGKQRGWEGQLGLQARSMWWLGM